MRACQPGEVELAAAANVVDIRSRRNARLPQLDEVELAALLTARYALSTLDACLPGLAGVGDLRSDIDRIVDAERDARDGGR